jgi:uncharacterized protein (TIGR00290 family)
LPPNSPIALVSWSGGKDSAWALHEIRLAGEYELAGLLTTFNEPAKRVAMHGIRKELVERQAQALDLPLFPVQLPWPCSNEEYESRLTETLQALIDELSITHIIFGDLYLQDIRDYREKQMSDLGLQTVFPLWGRDTSELSRSMIDGGLKAIISCVDTDQLDAAYSGRNYDDELLESLPKQVDPCGENGEFHTLVHDGPMFTEALNIEVGNQTKEPRFVFTDLLQAGVEKQA